MGTRREFKLHEFVCSTNYLHAETKQLAAEVKQLEANSIEASIDILNIAGSELKEPIDTAVVDGQAEVEMYNSIPNPIPRTRCRLWKEQVPIPHPDPPKYHSPLFKSIDFHMLECDSDGITNIVRPISCGAEDRYNRPCRMNFDRKIRRIAFDVDQPILVRLQQFKCIVHEKITHYFKNPQV